MAIEAHSVRLNHIDGTSAEGLFRFDPDEAEDDCRLTLQFEDRLYSATSGDYFEAMSDIRGELEKERWQLVCYGSSRNVFPSAMSRNMGSRGQMAYKLRLGRQARDADLVDIFEPGSDVEPVSVKEQQDYFEQWIASLSKG